MGFMSYLRERKHLRLFTKAFRQTLEERRGKDVTEANYQTCIKGCDDPKKMRQLMHQTEKSPNMYGGIADWDWDSILKWIQVYFIPLVRALLPLMLMLDSRE